MLKHTPLILLALTAQAASHNDYKVEARETIHHVFQNDSTLDVDEVNGAISIVADTGNTIRVDAEKIIRGTDQQEVDRGKREVVLDINEKDHVAQLYVNGPFRTDGHASENHGFHDHSDRNYEVVYNFTVHVPRTTELRLRTVNGAVKTEDIAGKFTIRTVNGAVLMMNIAGSGTSETVNGATTVVFSENPKADSYFKTLNGKVDVTLLPGLSADLQLKTFNGQAYTNFDLTATGSVPAGIATREDGKFRYKSNEFRTLRAGAGGPVLKFETFNGNININKKGQ